MGTATERRSGDETRIVDASPLWEKVESEGRRLVWLAARTGTDLSWVGKMARGTRPTRKWFLDRAAIALGVDAGDLIARVYADGEPFKVVPVSRGEEGDDASAVRRTA